MATSLCTIAAVTLLSASVGAKTWECGERSNLPQEGKTYCAAGDFRQSEINLQKILDVLLEIQQSTYGDALTLRKAQTAFESYRDSQCIAENKRIADKPFHLMIVSQCKTRLTNLRIDELKRMQDRYRRQ